ncbi:MAG: 6-hydroxymethylpterin diphosphokinase MptE-like protein [Thermoplasmata archaeon]
MRPELWAPVYARICEDFGFDPARDEEAARLLSHLVGSRSDRSLELVRRDFPSRVVICGGAQSLEDAISSTDLEDPVVAADSATTVLLESGIRPHMVVTDLDGIVEDQQEVNAAGAPVFVHAHGDNIPALRAHVGRFTGPVVGTCQCKPPEHVYNFGGFTDGDRAACICAELGARVITLLGFDFENPAEKKGKSRDIKRRKLAWARKIINELRNQGVDVTIAEPRV